MLKQLMFEANFFVRHFVKIIKFSVFYFKNKFILIFIQEVIYVQIKTNLSLRLSFQRHLINKNPTSFKRVMRSKLAE